MSGLATVRAEIASWLASTSANVYPYSPPVPSTPAVIIVPANPYLEPIGINGRGNLRANYRLTAAVAMNDNQGSLEQLEDLMLQIIAAVPAGVELSSFEAPGIAQVGATSLLLADCTLKVTTTG